MVNICQITILSSNDLNHVNLLSFQKPCGDTVCKIIHFKITFFRWTWYLIMPNLTSGDIHVCRMLNVGPGLPMKRKRFALSLTSAEISANLCFFQIFEKFRSFGNFIKFAVWSWTMHLILNFSLFHTISYRFRDKHFKHKTGKTCYLLKIVNPWSIEPHYKKAHILSIGNITAKFEEATPLSYIYSPDKKMRRPPP